MCLYFIGQEEQFVPGSCYFRLWQGARSGGMPERPVPERGTPPEAKVALSQRDAAAHPPEPRCANEDIARGYACRSHALLRRRGARTKRNRIYETVY